MDTGTKEGRSFRTDRAAQGAAQGVEATNGRPREKADQKKTWLLQTMSYDNVIVAPLVESINKIQADRVKKHLRGDRKDGKKKQKEKKKKKKLSTKQKKELVRRVMQEAVQPAAVPEVADQGVADQGVADQGAVSAVAELTPSQVALLGRQRKRIEEHAKKIAALSPQQQLDKVNKDFQKIPLHFDMPKLGSG